MFNSYNVKQSTSGYHMISKLSHEIRTPLAIIHSNLQLLNNENFTADAKLKEEAFNLSFLALKNIIQLLDNISLLNKSKHESLEIHLSQTNVLDLINIVVDELNSIKEYNRRIRVNHELIRNQVKIDAFLVEQVLSNVITNALKYSDHESQVDFCIEQDDDNIYFQVTDYGIGIPEADIENIYDSFYRGKNTQSVKGTGLGLNIVQRCLEMLNGSIHISSQLNHGTTVQITIPYEQ